jgi:hypothetical protein
MNLFIKIKKHLKIFFHKTIHYGFPVAFWDMLDSQRNKTGVFSEKITNKKYAAIIKWLTNRFQYLISAYKNRFDENTAFQGSIPPIIWICWWDGIEAMPPLVRACYNSLLKHKNGYKTNLITKDNFKNFVSVSEHIIEKLKTGIITVTHFSDILRMALLAEYGGLWLDATILVTGTIQLGNVPFFTVKRDFGGKDVPRRRWTGFCIGGQKNNLLFEFAKDFFNEYWMKNNDMIDYFLIDYIIVIAYNSFSLAKQMIDNVDNNNPDVFVMQYNIKNEFSLDFIKKLENTTFHKLNWKRQYAIITSNNNPTLYGYILKIYNNDSLQNFSFESCSN